MEKLNVGDTFPHFDVRTDTDDRLIIPEKFKGHYAVVLFYRGGW